MNEQIKINWYRTKIDRQVMSELMKSSDFRGLCQVVPQFALYLTTGALSYLAFLNIHAANWQWSVPLLLLALFAHGTVGSFMGAVGPIHELSHKTPFRTKSWNDFFLKLFSFVSWTDYVSYRPSHVKHHQVTVHEDHDGEVVLPQTFDWDSFKLLLPLVTFDPAAIFRTIRTWVRCARGDMRDKGEWINKVVPESNTALRREHRDWARTVVLGHLSLATLFVATGNWFLVIIFTFGCFLAPWLAVLCALPQHIGLSPNVSDFRLCCRTYTCSWLPAFLYWNLQYHVEHHMFPAVPFYNLPRLRKAIEHDLPPAPHGLWATWSEILPILKKQREDPHYTFVPKLPGNEGDLVGDDALAMEAARAT
ncbi:MAG: fatty acid desaturase [Terrimicrobiaceae bacterium]|nr:fatty acid desaturase [Terrimicrobiaceae bacterium]